MEEKYYITVFSLRIYKYLKKKNVFPLVIEQNKKYPQYSVFKYDNDPFVLDVINKFRTGEIEG